MLFKIVTKTIANKLKRVLSDIIEEFHSVFVSNRLSIDNALIAFECYHFMKNKGRKGFMDLKLDMSKTYDEVE